MDNFSLFKQALEEYTSKTICNKNESKNENKNTTCLHPNIIIENGIKSCINCGKEINMNISYNKEWRYYGSSDTRHNSDPNRCQTRKIEDRTIYKDVENMGFSDKIISMANNIYEEVTNKKIFRGKSRKAIVFACIFHAYKLEGNPQSCENLINVFNLDRKIGLKGLKHVSLNAPKDSKIRTVYITPENLIKEIMDKFNAPANQIEEVIKLYQQVKNKSSVLNRSRPQSVASGLVKYYIDMKNKPITMSDFKEKIHLSELTINRIVKEIEKILHN